MNRNRKKMIIGVLSFTLLFGISASNIQAESERKPQEAETDIKVKVKRGSIEEPGEIKPEGTETNPDGEKGELSIWLKPKKMTFEGSYSEVSDYELELDRSEDTASLRHLVVADVRRQEIGWRLEGQLTELSADQEDAPSVHDHKLSMDLNVGKHDPKKEGFHVEYIKMKGIRPGGSIVDSEDYTKSNVTLSKETMMIGETEGITEATPRPGKGYTVFKMSDLKLQMPAGEGYSENYSGKVLWNLSSTAQ